jgi:hypothetical protein
MSQQQQQKYIFYKSYSAFPDHLVDVSSFQRHIVETHLNKIILYIIDCTKSNCMPYLGTIELAHFLGLIYVIDGQHRLAALKKVNHDKIPIQTMNYYVYDYESIELIFKLRNKNYEVPRFIKKLNKNQLITTNLLNQIDSYLTNQCEWTVFSPSGSCNRPKINKDKFMKMLMSSNHLLERIKSIDDFKRILKLLNEYCKSQVQDPAVIKRFKISEKMFLKFQQIGCYLGYDSDLNYFNVVGH